MATGPYGKIISDKVNELLRSSRDKKLLEAGCGSASYFDFEDITKSVGIDIDDTQLRANKILQETILGDVQTYPLPKDEFDIVVCWDVVEHLPQPKDALQNMFNTVKPGGLLILGFPHLLSFKGLVTKATPFWFHEAVYRHMKYTSRHFPTYLRAAILPNRIIKLAKANNFSVVFSEMREDSLTQKLRQRYWPLNILFVSIDAAWRIATAGKSASLLMDNCVLILRKIPQQ
jgi:2-polyprenyl-3-methyl-5-hydroxy-6-metoxy-1,4-benzoquinol methylase